MARSIAEATMACGDMPASSKCIELTHLVVNELIPQGKAGMDDTQAFVFFLHEGKYIQVGSFTIPRTWGAVEVVKLLSSSWWESKVGRMMEFVPGLDRLRIQPDDIIDLMKRESGKFRIESYVVTMDGIKPAGEDIYEHP